MKNKWIRMMTVVLVCAFFMVFAIASGSDDSEDVSSDDMEVTTSEDNDVESEEAEEAEEAEEENVESVESSVEEAVIFEQDGIKVTVKELVYGGLWGPELKVLVENDSEVGVTVQSRMVSVNDYMMDPFFSVDVEPGKKANDSITFTSDDFEKANVSEIINVELKLHIFNSESWDDIMDSDVIAINTNSSATQDGDDSGEVMYEGNDIKIILKGIDYEDSIMGPEILLYIENNSDKEISVQTRDTSINGFMIDGIFSSDLAPEKKMLDGVTFFSTDLEDNDIETFDEIELSFHIYEADSWDTIVDTDPIVVTIN